MLSNKAQEIIIKLGQRGLLNWIPDKPFVKLMFRIRVGKRLNLKTPKTLNEKLQWLKLYNRKPQYTTMVDKYAVKKYIGEQFGAEYIIPTLGVWDKFEDIDFDSLPNQFVLKCTHDSGGLVICRDKATLNLEAAKAKINKSLKNNFFWHGREWPYKNVPPKIIAEKYMADSPESEEFTDYKFYCFNGYPDCVLVCYDRESGDTKYYFFDRNWELKRYNKQGKEAPENFTLPKPENMNKMFELAEKVAKEIAAPFLRVDLYSSEGQIYFGELTFFPSSGFDKKRLPETDLHFGELVNLDNV